MQPQYETSRLLLSVSHPDKAAGVLEFYERNRDFLEPYEPVKRPGFYSPDFQRTNLTFEYNSFVKARHLRMWMYLRDHTDVPIGTICFSNFLHGAFSSCMLGYKTDKDHLQQGYMTEALSFLIPLGMPRIPLSPDRGICHAGQRSVDRIAREAHLPSGGAAS